MKKEIFINFVLTFLSNFILFIQNKYFIQYMGIEILGMMKLFSQLLGYLNIIEMGVSSASAFALYKPLSEKDYHQVSIIVNTIENIYNKIAILLFILGILCTPIIPFFIKISGSYDKVFFYWILYVFNTVSTYLFIKYIILFTANQELLYVRFIQTLSKCLFQLIQIYCIIKFNSFFIYIFLLVLDNFTQWLVFRNHYKRIYSCITKTKEKFIKIKSDIKNLFWHRIGGIVVFNTDLILISKFTDLKIVGIYASYLMVFQVLRITMGILNNVLSPKIGRFIAQYDKTQNYSYFKKINILYCFISIFFTYCTYSLINDFIIIWLGKEFLLPDMTLKLLCFNLFTVLFRGNLENFKEGAGFFDDIKAPILESVINLITSIALGIKMGLNGIIIGTIISNIIIILIYKPILVFKRCFDKDIKDYIKIYGNYIVLINVSLVSLNFVTKSFIKENIFSWFEGISYAIKISSTSLITITIIFLLNKEFRNLLKNILNK